MRDESDIVKELRDAEKFGLIQSIRQSICEKLKGIDESIDKTSNQTSHIIKEQEKRIKGDALENLEEKFRTIFENSTVGIMLSNENKQIISWNKFTEDLLGMDKEDLYLKSVELLYPPEEWQKIRSQNIRQKGLQYHMETKMINKNNEGFDVDLSLCVLKNHNGSIVGSIGVIQDITNRKKVEKALRESEQKFKQLYERAPTPYYTLSPDGVITDVNQKWCKIFGYSKLEVIGKSIFDFIIKEEREREISSFNNMLRLKKLYTVGHERMYVTKDGKEKTFVTYNFIFYNNDHQVLSIQTTMEDNTDKLNMEKQFKESNKLLKIVNRELERKIQDRTNQIQELLKQKDELITRLGHDLKTPITILMNIIPLIDEEIDNPTAKKDCNTAIRNLIYIKNLVKEILKISELTSPTLVLEKKEMLLNELINEILNDNQILFHVKNITVKNFINTPIIINGDKIKLKEVLYNLINNAIKFTPEDGDIVLRSYENKETITVSITDNGLGMNKEQIRNIFNYFYKIDKSRHNLEGSGLGLSICKRIIEKHDGEIWAESEGEQKGSTFFFKIPKINKVIN